MELHTKNTFTSTPIDGGYSWTVTTLLGRFLKHAEDMFGPRDRSYTLLGVEFCNKGQPQNWFPGYPECKHISIILTPECETDINQAIFQLSHEVVHALCPSPGHPANVLEEGLATSFSHKMSGRYGNSMRTSMEKYRKAKEYADRLLEYDQDIIKKARENCNDISSITKEQIKEICPQVEGELLDILLMPFEDFGNMFN